MSQKIFTFPVVLTVNVEAEVLAESKEQAVEKLRSMNPRVIQSLGYPYYEVKIDESPDRCFSSDPEFPYSLSDNQYLFVKDAEDQGYEVDFDYSGRGMYGKTCPAVRLDREEKPNTSAQTEEDSMGLGYVVYARY